MIIAKSADDKNRVSKDGDAVAFTCMSPKPWRFVTSSRWLADALNALKCRHNSDFKHGELAGATDIAKTARYPAEFCRTYFTYLCTMHALLE